MRRKPDMNSRFESRALFKPVFPDPPGSIQIGGVASRMQIQADDAYAHAGTVRFCTASAPTGLVSDEGTGNALRPHRKILRYRRAIKCLQRHARGA
ncbi:MAG: hypothetical protein ACK4UO_09185 [Pseudolabrys sp.]